MSNPTMIERVARAIIRARVLNHYRVWKPAKPPTEELIAKNVEAHWHIAVDDARAAMSAMSDPTPEMIDAIDITKGGVTGVYQAMIDAALAEEPR